MRERKIVIEIKFPQLPPKRWLYGGAAVLLLLGGIAYAAATWPSNHVGKTLTAADTDGYFNDLNDRSWQGTGALRYFTGGSVGVGLSSPNSALGVAGPAGTGTNLTAGQVSVQNTTGTSLLAGLVVRKGDGTPLWEVGNLSGATQQLNIQDDVANATRLFITSSGNVGIGPAGGYATLDVLGHIRTSIAGGVSRGMEFWTISIGGGTTCDTGCGNGYCIGSYLDDGGVTKAACSSSSLGRNCICLGRP